MSTPILATKLYIPPPRPKVVVRARLIEQLNDGLPHKLTLISAPAGFGKTTLVSEWLVGSGRPVAWLSLDEADNEPTHFLAYIIAALQTTAAAIGTEALGALQMLPPPATESILTTLINEISRLADPFILVLDDYHVIEAQAIDQALTFLLENLPPQMHLVITTREDPQLPLARMRVRGQLTELRAADLRFTAAEAAEFLNASMGLQLSAHDIAALEDRTEGWIAGLQLAALALQGPMSRQGQDEVSGFIRTFAGDHRYIVDYLVEEVLQRQPEPIRNFLIQTAILDQLNGAVCEAVTGEAGGSARLEALERGNFFIVPLDDKRQWYRYHHLFAEVLRARLRAEQPELVLVLHGRASEWYAQNGFVGEAIRHALAGKDFAQAANLVELAMPEMRRSRQETRLLDWLKALPDELVRTRPVLSTGYAGALLSIGTLEGVETRLQDAEQWLDKTVEMNKVVTTEMVVTDDEMTVVDDEMTVVDDEEFRRLPGSIAVYRAGLALALGKVADTVKYARQALDLIPEEDYLRLGAAAALLGLASWASGDLEAAYKAYGEGMAKLQKAGYVADVIGCTIAMADIRIGQGRLHEAMNLYARGLQLGLGQGKPVLRGTAGMYVGLSALYFERNDLKAAGEHLQRSKELGDFAGLPQNPYRWCVAMAQLREAEGDLDGALVLLDEAERLYVSDFLPNVQPVAALKTRVWIAQGRLGEALSWARERGLTVEDDLSYLREFEHITLARLLLARYKGGLAGDTMVEALELLKRLLKAADEGGRTGSVIEILMLQALVQYGQGDIPAALGPLERALTLAEPEGYFRLFIDEGPAIAELLRAVDARGSLRDYTGKLLAGFETNADNSPPAASPVSQPLIEPLSQRELEVLRLFKTELSGPEIAHELVIALSTVRAHTKQIYSKLDVNNRRSAIKRATELGLI
jgi:LuxR family transcriptional regulator, maltose regulon positive regulatory protein